ncbi:hypothetical protein [Arsenophonus nasoniae]|uniref:Uncharacterized protein n=1 Tax=Arsenophonus nasoniae TaxID=638 RepID=A0ABY8NXC0_9GAMM|nr:hypothetical protein [Arsenophonus nasoniae]WGM09031.1 hypothetical protein QE258_27120 [Arsenophonus nasoniae]
MKQIKFYLTDEQYLQAEVMAKSKGFKSINQMAKEKTLQLDNVKTSFEVSKEQKVTRTTVSLYEYESTALESYAKANGTSLSREMALRLRQTLFPKHPCLYPFEIEELRKMNSEAKRIGRNIAYVIKGGRYCTVNDPEFRQDIRQLMAIMSDLVSQVESLRDHALNRFG